MKLTIKNFNNLANYFDGTDYTMRAFSEAGDSYQITVLHRRMSNRYVFIIKRDGYLSGGEWHYTTHIESHPNYGSMTWKFMKYPTNFVNHIIASIEL